VRRARGGRGGRGALAVPPGLPLASQLRAAAAPETPAAPPAAWEQLRSSCRRSAARRTTVARGRERRRGSRRLTSPPLRPPPLRRRPPPRGRPTPSPRPTCPTPPQRHPRATCVICARGVAPATGSARAHRGEGGAAAGARARGSVDMEVWHAVEVPNGDFIPLPHRQKGGAHQRAHSPHSGCRCINILDESRPGALLRRIELCGGTEQVSRADADIRRRRVSEFQLRRKQRAEAATVTAAGKLQEH